MSFKSAFNYGDHKMLGVGSVAEFQCDIGAKLLNTAEELEVHMNIHKTHSEEAELQCDICAKLLNTKSSLIKHCRTKHREVIRKDKCCQCNVDHSWEVDIKKEDKEAGEDEKLLNEEREKSPPPKGGGKD
jgi:hypothetical protein